MRPTPRVGSPAILDADAIAAALVPPLQDCTPRAGEVANLLGLTLVTVAGKTPDVARSRLPGKARETLDGAGITYDDALLQRITDTVIDVLKARRRLPEPFTLGAVRGRPRDGAPA